MNASCRPDRHRGLIARAITTRTICKWAPPMYHRIAAQPAEIPNRQTGGQIDPSNSPSRFRFWFWLFGPALLAPASSKPTWSSQSSARRRRHMLSCRESWPLVCNTCYLATWPLGHLASRPLGYLAGRLSMVVVICFAWQPTAWPTNTLCTSNWPSGAALQACKPVHLI